MSRQLIATGKSVPTPGGHRAVLIQIDRHPMPDDQEEPDDTCHCNHPECGAC